MKRISEVTAAWAPLSVAVALAGCAAGHRAAPEMLPAAREAWLRLPASKNACPGFDYFPEGGMRSFYCHLKSILDFAGIQKLAGMPAFRKGPHSRETLELRSLTDFGRYRKEFVRWLRDHLVPSRDSALRQLTQPIYDSHVRSLARFFFLTHQKLHSNPAYLEGEKSRFLALLKAKDLRDGYYEKYFFFMNPLFFKNPEARFEFFVNRGMDGGLDGNVVKTCVAFWIRRSIDGTDREFFLGLEKLLEAYDPKWLESARRGALPPKS